MFMTHIILVYEKLLFKYFLLKSLDGKKESNNLLDRSTQLIPLKAPVKFCILDIHFYY